MTSFQRIIQPYDTRIASNQRATLPAVDFERRITRINITGPIGSQCEIFMGTEAASSRVDKTARGSSNTAEYTNPLIVPSGTQVIVRWDKPGNATATFSVTA